MEYINASKIKSAVILSPIESPDWQKRGWQLKLNMGECAVYIDRNSEDECKILAEQLKLTKI